MHTCLTKDLEKRKKNFEEKYGLSTYKRWITWNYLSSDQIIRNKIKEKIFEVKPKLNDNTSSSSNNSNNNNNNKKLNLSFDDVVVIRELVRNNNSNNNVFNNINDKQLDNLIFEVFDDLYKYIYIYFFHIF
jgi:hypothetical protein